MLRKDAAEAIKKLILAMQTKIDNWLNMMYGTIHVLHKEQSLMDKHIQMLMPYIDILVANILQTINNSTVPSHVQKTINKTIQSPFP